MAANDFSAVLHIGTVDIEAEGYRSSCIIKEQFEPLLTRTFQCGAGFKRTIKRRIGVSQEDREKLQGLIDYELGVESLAKLRSRISSEIGTTVRLDLLEEVTEEYTFPVDPCDRRVMQLCQKQRIYEFWCTRSRLFGFIKREYSFTVTEWLDEVAERSSIIKYHPDCGCKAEVQNPLGFVFVQIAQKISLIAPYFASVSGEKAVGIINVELPEAAEGHWAGTIPASVVPRYLLFMADEAYDGDLPIVIRMLPGRIFDNEQDDLRDTFDVVSDDVSMAIAAVARFVKQRPAVSLAIAAGLGIALALYTRRLSTRYPTSTGAPPPTPDEDDEPGVVHWAEETRSQEHPGDVSVSSADRTYATPD